MWGLLLLLLLSLVSSHAASSDGSAAPAAGLKIPSTSQLRAAAAKKEAGAEANTPQLQPGSSAGAPPTKELPPALQGVAVVLNVTDCQGR